MQRDKFNPLDPDDAMYLELFWRMVADLQDPIMRHALKTKKEILGSLPVWDRRLI